jgi:hypothetical protein
VLLAAITAAWTPLVYPATAAFLRSRNMLKSMVGNKPYRDGYRTFFVPWGVGDDYADELNEQVRALAGEDGLVLLPYLMIGVGVLYEQAAGGFPEAVTIDITQRHENGPESAEWRADLRTAVGAGRPVVLVPQDRDSPEDLVPGAAWTRCGDLYVLTSLDPVPATQPHNRH